MRDHHKKVKRIELAADSELSGLVPFLGEHFVQGEVKSFTYDELTDAIKWAGVTVT